MHMVTSHYTYCWWVWHHWWSVTPWKPLCTAPTATIQWLNTFMHVFKYSGRPVCKKHSSSASWLAILDTTMRTRCTRDYTKVLSGCRRNVTRAQHNEQVQFVNAPGIALSTDQWAPVPFHASQNRYTSCELYLLIYCRHSLHSMQTHSLYLSALITVIPSTLSRPTTKYWNSPARTHL